MNAKKIILLAVLMQLGVVCFGQELYILNSQFGFNAPSTMTIGTAELTACEFSQDTLVDLYDYGPFRRKLLAINEDGAFIFMGWTDYLGQNVQQAKVIELTLDNPYNTAYFPPIGIISTFSSTSEMMSIGNDLVYFTTDVDRMALINLSNNFVLQDIIIPNWQLGKAHYVDGFLYVTAKDVLAYYRYSKILKIDPLTGTIVTTINTPVIENEISYLNGGITSSWKSDCSGKQLIVSLLKDNFSDEFNILGETDQYFGLIDLDNLSTEFNIFCEKDITDNLYSVTNKTISSWETHRQVCEVRIDLDEDDSQGRAGPHSRNTNNCSQLFPIADADVAIWTIDNRPIDSVQVRVKDFGSGSINQLLRYPPSSTNFSITSVNDTLLTVLPLLPEIPYADWEDLLTTINLEINPNEPTGLRVIGTSIHAGGLIGDEARTYINYIALQVSAGDDNTIYTCRSQPVGLTGLIAANASLTGYWKPELTYQLFPNSGIPGFDQNLLEFGTFNYIVAGEDGCGGFISDTAVIQIHPYPILSESLPYLTDTVTICEGSSYEWNPLTIPNVVVGNYLDNSIIPITGPRTYTESGEYLALVFYNWIDEDGFQQLCQEIITLKLEVSPLSGNTVTLDTTICEGQTIQLGGNTYDQFGNYQFTAASQDGCTIQYNLNITERAAVMVELDTTLCAGETLLYAGAAFGSAGVYNVNNTIGVGCDTIYRIFLSYFPANLTELDTAIIAGQSLTIADTVLTSSGTYTFTYPGNDGCDSLFRVNLEVTTGLNGTPPSETRYQATNPIRTLRGFHVFDTGTGGTVEVTHLEIFTGDGRRVGTWSSLSALPDERLPAGVYLYRIRPEGEDRLVVGRVVVF